MMIANRPRGNPRGLCVSLSWGGWTRTNNIPINSRVVCQLTYAPSQTKKACHLIWQAALLVSNTRQPDLQLELRLFQQLRLAARFIMVHNLRAVRPGSNAFARHSAMRRAGGAQVTSRVIDRRRRPRRAANVIMSPHSMAYSAGRHDGRPSGGDEGAVTTNASRPFDRRNTLKA